MLAKVLCGIATEAHLIAMKNAVSFSPASKPVDVCMVYPNETVIPKNMVNDNLHVLEDIANGQIINESATVLPGSWENIKDWKPRFYEREE